MSVENAVGEAESNAIVSSGLLTYNPSAVETELEAEVESFEADKLLEAERLAEVALLEELADQVNSHGILPDAISTGETLQAEELAELSLSLERATQEQNSSIETERLAEVALLSEQAEPDELDELDEGSSLQAQLEAPVTAARSGDISESTICGGDAEPQRVLVEEPEHAVDAQFNTAERASAVHSADLASQSEAFINAADTIGQRHQNSAALGAEANDIAVLEAPAVARVDAKPEPSEATNSRVAKTIDASGASAASKTLRPPKAAEKPSGETTPRRPSVKVEPLLDKAAEIHELAEAAEPQQPIGWRAKAAALLAKALSKAEAPVKEAPKRKRAPRKKTAASNTDGVTAKPRAKRKPRAKVQPTVKKGLFARVMARMGFADQEPVVAPKTRRKKASTTTEGRTAPRKPRAAAKKRAASKKAPVKKGLFGRVLARFGLGEEEAPVKRPSVRKPVDPNAPKKPPKPRATRADGTPKKRAPRKKAAPKSTLQRAVDKVLGGWRSLRNKDKD